MSHQFGCVRDLILRAFDRLQKRVLSPCYQQQKTIARPAECRNELRSVLDGQAAGGSGADIYKTAPPAQPPHDCKSGSFDGGPSGSRSGDGCELPLDHRLQYLSRFPDVDLGVTGTWPFRFHVVLGRWIMSSIDSR